MRVVAHAMPRNESARYDPDIDHDDWCESEYEHIAHAYTPCDCANRNELRRRGFTVTGPEPLLPTMEALVEAAYRLPRPSGSGDWEDAWEDFEDALRVYEEARFEDAVRAHQEARNAT